MPPEDSTSKDWIQLDRLADDLGEDPGRYLDGPLDPFPRIRGLASIEAVRGFDAAERKIARIQNRAPRSSILDALEQREAWLREHGEFNPDLAPKTITVGWTPEVLEDVFGSPDPGSGTRIPPGDGPSFPEPLQNGHVTIEWDPETIRRRYSEEPASDPSDRAVAADGGEDRADGR